MKIEDRSLLVSGMYLIKGMEGFPSTLNFPVPAGPNYGEIDSLHVFDVSNNIYIKTQQQNKNTIDFTLDFKNTNEHLIQIHYRLLLKGNKVEYPLNPSIHGNRKLDKAFFYLFTPNNLMASRFNYTPKDTIDAGENTVYYWEMMDFLPEENFKFSFRQLN